MGCRPSFLAIAFACSPPFGESDFILSSPGSVWPGPWRHLKGAAPHNARDASSSFLHHDLFGHHADDFRVVAKVALVGTDHVLVARRIESALDLFDAVGPQLHDPVILGPSVVHASQCFRRKLTTLHVSTDVACEVLHTQSQGPVLFGPIPVELPRRHPLLALDQHRYLDHHTPCWLHSVEAGRGQLRSQARQASSLISACACLSQNCMSISSYRLLAVIRCARASSPLLRPRSSLAKAK